MIEVEHESTYRTVTVRAVLSDSSETPPDVRKRYSSVMIRPDSVEVTLAYREQIGRWEVGISEVEVSGHRMLKGDRLSELRSNTKVTRDQAPWAWEWADRLLERLNEAETPKLPQLVTLG